MGDNKNNGRMVKHNEDDMMMSWELANKFKRWLNARMALRDDGVSSNNTKETPCSVPKTSGMIGRCQAC